MINKNSVIRLLDTIVHPETGQGLSSGGFIKDVVIGNDGRRIEVLLKFPRVREPFAASLRRKASVALSEAFPGIEISVEVFSEAGSGNSISASAGTSVSAGTAASVPAGTSAPAGSGDFGSKSSPAPSRHLPGVKRVIAVASGKGGVGKSTMAANLAVALAAKGLRVGVLDADIYGPSQPALFGVEDYMPPASGEEPDALIVPVESRGVKVMSIGFFIDPSDALVWRGPMATNALRQLIRQTAWGELDYLLIDLPPGTGDVHLSVVHDLALDGAIVVSTPGELALADVRRGVQMFRSEGINVPVLGIVENMAWFSPAELPGSRYYVFGEGGARRFASEEGLDFLGEIPLVLPSGADRDAENASQAIESTLTPYYSVIAEKIVDKLSKVCWKP